MFVLSLSRVPSDLVGGGKGESVRKEVVSEGGRTTTRPGYESCLFLSDP